MATVTIPKTQYVGVNLLRSTDGSMPLGFLTPGGTDAAAKKRISTVDNWINKGQPEIDFVDAPDKERFEKDNPDAKWVQDYDNASPVRSKYHIPRVEGVAYKVYDNVPNEPRFGFRITQAISRGGSWNGNNKVVRIEDPRGFELEISVDNLVKMMSMTTFVDGVCQEKCVWGRQGAANVLLPVNSVPYTEAVSVTAYRAKETISLRDVNFGDTVVLKKTENFQGLAGEYMGAYHVYSLQTLYKSDDVVGTTSYYSRNTNGHIFVKSHKRYIIKNGDKYFGVSGCKIDEITNRVDTPVERPDLCADNYKDLSQGQVGTIICLTTNKIPVKDLIETTKFVPADDLSVLDDRDAGSCSIWAKDSKTDQMLLFTRAYYSSYHSHGGFDESAEERMKLFEGEITKFDLVNNRWEVTGVRGEGGHGPFHILKNPLAKAALSVEEYEWFQLAFTVNGKLQIVPVVNLSRW